MIVSVAVGGTIIAVGACGSTTGTKSAAPKEVGVKAISATTETPQACKDALDEAEQVFEVARDLATTTSKIFFTIKDAMAAVAASDVSGIEQATSDIEDGTAGINALTERVKKIMPSYQAHAATCRAG